ALVQGSEGAGRLLHGEDPVRGATMRILSVGALVGGLTVLLPAAGRPLAAQATLDAPAGRADAIIDLTTVEGVRLVKGQWRFHDAEIVEATNRNPGPDLKPSGAPNRTHD